ncbi:Uma2 family endonuclease [Nocardiopsis mwathae]|uniref:Uma2 family endonuclease n=1 Tax=Nocardiopsis mwathae TaxID=1472723 RepID=A0A7W9YHJ0_9ACTN|nr:Uma2 family endonuclease [Nocardiopsis mwathae]MBB6172270.1 Uma2 family endonuclease [Nocardiopsis mwathae]
MATVGDDKDPACGGSDMTTTPVVKRSAESASSKPKGVTWPVPPPDGYTAEDLDRIPDLPPHTELIDGSLVFVSPQKVFHMVTKHLLFARLDQAVPDHLLVAAEVTVTLGKRQRPEPDLLVLKADYENDLDQSNYTADAVELAIEIVSPDSEERDRERKPQLYAEAGIPHFWRIENDGGNPVVYVYELDPATKAYALTAIHRDRLKVTVPYDMDIDISEVTRRGRGRTVS